MRIFFHFILGSILFQNILFAQKQGAEKIDSLELALKSTKNDTSKINILNSLGWEIKESNSEKATWYDNQSLELIAKLQSQPQNTFLTDWLQLATTTVYNNLGTLHNVVTQDHKKALEYHLKSLTIEEKLLSSSNNWIAFKSKKALGNTYKNIGSVYRTTNNDTAVMYLMMALPLLEQTNDKRGITLIFTNMGDINQEKGNYNEALKYYNNALEIAVSIKNKRSEAIALLSIGNIFTLMGDTSKTNQNKLYNKGLDYFFNSLSVAETDKNKTWIWSALVSIQAVYREQKKFSEAKEYCLRSLKVAKEMKSKPNEASSLYYLSQIFLKSNDFKNAYSNYILYDNTNDSLTNLQLTSQISDVQQKFNEEKRQRKLEIKATIKDAETKSQLKEQKLIIIGVAMGLLFVLIFAGFIFRSLRERNKQNHIIIEQKNILEEKQKEITDSINYAKQIQNSLLANHEILNENLRDYFVLFIPKDIVSGDFYWAVKKENAFYLAVCDSTGHGVPGAFMSLLNINYLNEAVIEKNIEHPNEILNYVRKKLIDNTVGGNDGMDATVLRFEKNKISYSSANNKPILVTGNYLEDLVTDKMPVGKGEKNDSFTLHEINIKKENTLYLFSDGYTDQFGGELGQKKLTRKKFKELILSIQQFTMKEQQNILEKFIIDYHSNVEQTDDILVIGIKV